MRCQECQELLTISRAEELSSAQGERLRSHLQECPECREACSELEAAREALSGWNSPSVPEGMAARTLAALEAERAAQPSLWERVRQFFERQLNADVTPLRGVLATALGLMLFGGLMNVERASSVKAASAGSCQKQLNQVCRAVEAYQKDHQGELPQDLDALIPSYLSHIPNCPEAGFDTYSPGYKPDSEGGRFLLYCDGHFHSKDGLDKNHPRCGSEL
jgi:hypothetical protein